MQEVEAIANQSSRDHPIYLEVEWLELPVTARSHLAWRKRVVGTGGAQRFFARAELRELGFPPDHPEGAYISMNGKAPCLAIIRFNADGTVRKIWRS